MQLNAFPRARQAKAVPRGPIIDRIEELFRSRRYQSLTLVDLYDHFEQDRPEAIRNAVRKLMKGNLVKSTGELKPPAYTKLKREDLLHQSDMICLTLTIGK